MSDKKAAKSSVKVLPIADILHDLAVLRASGTEVPGTLLNDPNISSGTPPPVAESVARSYDYTQAARAIIKLQVSGKVDGEGGKIDDLRSKSEGLLEVLENHDSS